MGILAVVANPEKIGTFPYHCCPCFGPYHGCRPTGFTSNTVDWDQFRHHPTP